MWLLDVNMPRQLKGLLAELDIQAETADARGWRTLVNGESLEAAATSGFDCLPTRDRLFGESVVRNLRRHPELSIVIVLLPQVRAAQFLASFRIAWASKPIAPAPGQIQSWSCSGALDWWVAASLFGPELVADVFGPDPVKGTAQRPGWVAV